MNTSWESWLASMTTALCDFDQRLTAGGTAVFPELALPSAADPLPADLVARIEAVQEDLARVTGRAEQARDRMAAALAVVARPRARSVAGYGQQVGSTLDVAC